MPTKRPSYAFKIDTTVDNGAYNSLGHVVIERALLMLSGSYNIPNVHAESRLVYTNNHWGSVARGAGPPQGHFALECAINMLADKMGIDPLEFRLQNSLKPGQTKSTGSKVEQWPFPELCEAIRPHYERACQQARKYENKTIKRGVGLAAGSFGIGGPGDRAIAAVELDPDGGVTIFAAAADPGEGNDSMFTQLAAAIMELPLNKIRLVTRDTDRTTSTGPAAASRITYMVGGAVENALGKLKEAMNETKATTRQELEQAQRPYRYIGTKATLESGPTDPNTGQDLFRITDTHLTDGRAEVNTETGETKIIKMTTAVDGGPVIHPQIS